MIRRNCSNKDCRLISDRNSNKYAEVLSGDVKAKLAACKIALPEQFTYEVNYKDLKKAYQMSFYPGMEAVDARTNRLTSKNWMDIVTAHSFVVY